MKTISVISPHYDDAALSLALSIGLWLDAGVCVRVVNCFTQSDHAPHARIAPIPQALAGRIVARLRRSLSAHSAQGSAGVATFTRGRRIEIVSDLRRREDSVFRNCYSPPLGALDLGCVDAPAREDATGRPILGGRLSPADIEIVASLSEIFRRLTAEDSVIAPLGLGGHVDHRIARQAAIDAVGPSRLAFYEELPYAAGIGSEVVAAEVRDVQALTGLKEPLVKIVPAINSTVDKEPLISVYRSQFSRREFRGIAKLGGGAERIWAAGPWLAAYAGRGFGSPGGTSGTAIPSDVSVPN